MREGGHLSQDLFYRTKAMPPWFPLDTAALVGVAVADPHRKMSFTTSPDQIFFDFIGNLRN